MGLQERAQGEHFLRGALFITLAQLVTKVLGAIHRPVAQLFIGDAGLAQATPPTTAYYFILAMSAVGLNVAISRLVSERLALQDYRGARRVFRVAVGTLLVSGAVFTLIFSLGAGWLARIQGFPEARPGFLVLAPAVFLASVTVAFRGLYQGMQQMGPSALSQVVEQLGRVVVSIGLMYVFAPVSVVHGAAAFNAGNAAGMLLGVLYLAWITARRRVVADWTWVAPDVQSCEHASISALLGRIAAISLPITLIGAMPPIMNAVDSALVTNRLLSIGVAEAAAKEALAHLGNAGTLRDLPSVLSTALYISLVPAVTESMTRAREGQARDRASTAFRITCLIGIPASVALWVGARDIYGVLYLGSGYVVMGSLALSTVFLMLQQISSGVLQGMGLIWQTVRHLLTGIVLKVALTYWWTGLPSLQAQGAGYATTVGFAITASLNLWSLRHHLGLRLNLWHALKGPVLASALMAVVMVLLSPWAHRVIAADRLAGLLVVAVSGLTYLIAIFPLGGVQAAELALIPGMTQQGVDRLRGWRLLRD